MIPEIRNRHSDRRGHQTNPRRHRSARGTLRATCLAIAAILAPLLAGGVAAAPAMAASGNVYLVVFNSHCVGGGSITGLYGAVSDSWSGGDAGDNIIYPYVTFNRTDQFNGRALCSRPWYQGGSYWINVVGWDFRPTASGQAFYY